MTALSLTLYLGFITLAPLVCGLLVFGLGLAARLRWQVILALAIVGALFPAVGLPFLAPEVAFGNPLTLHPFGAGTAFGAWVMPTYRIDAFALYIALGLAYIATPFLLWLAFVERAQPEGVADAAGGSAEESDPEGSGSEPDEPAAAPARVASWRAWLAGARPATPALARAVALVLVLEGVALTLLFADSLVLLGVTWIVVAALTWALGEVTSDAGTIDVLGLAATLVGPVLWLVIFLFAARAAHATRLIALTGHTALTWPVCILLAVAIALAGGAYPAITWMRRRAALAAPVGVAALVLAGPLAALYLTARTYAVAADTANRWPVIGVAPQNISPTAPAPITAGIAYVALGAITLLICGLLALGRRDGRALLALLAAAQVGWGMVGVGAGGPASLLGVVLLLPSAALGLGAMLAALVVGGAVTSDIEPEADGPRPVGAPLRPLLLASWCIGAASLIGVPLFAGFAPRHLISVGSLEVAGLNIPLIGLCWFGDMLLALALLRATAPALADWGTGLPPRGGFWAVVSLDELPAGLLALLALVLGIVPGPILGAVVAVATEPLLWPASLEGLVKASGIGYTIGPAQWLGGLGWIVAVVVVALLVVFQLGAARVPAPVYRGGRGQMAPEQTSDETAAAAETAEPETLAPPTSAWSDIAPAFTSSWTLPAQEWLLVGIDDSEEGTEPEDTADETQDNVGEPVPVNRQEVPRAED